MNAEVVKALNTKRQLCPKAVPTIDSIENNSTQSELSNKDGGMVCTNFNLEPEPAINTMNIIQFRLCGMGISSDFDEYTFFSRCFIV